LEARGDLAQAVQYKTTGTGHGQRDTIRGLPYPACCIRMGVKDVSARWLKASKALKKEDQVYGQKVAEMARKHSSEAFYAHEDP
jgi:hypothetical protein